MDRKRSALERIKARAAEAEARIAARRAVEQTANQFPDVSADLPVLVDIETPSLSTAHLLEAKRRKLIEAEQLGFFTSVPLVPSSEYPTILTRLPIFRPTTKEKQKTLLDQDNALRFTTPFGNGKRWGPLLTVTDEDTLMALARIRSYRMRGLGHRLPIRVPEIYRPDPDGNYTVHTVVCTLTQILEEKGVTNAGDNYQATLESMKRLAATSLQIDVKRHDRYFGPMERGTTIKLLDVVWSVWDKDGVLLVQFSPIVARWLESEYTWIDWDVRKRLNALGKALHRYLSAQPREHHSRLEKIAATIGYDGPKRNMKPRFRTALERMVALDWLEAYEFRGTGRKQPLVLFTWRKGRARPDADIDRP